MNTMADGAAQRLVAQIGEALFGQPGMTLDEIANRLRELRGEGGPVLTDVGNPVAPSPAGQGDAWDTLRGEWAIDGMPADKQRLARAAFVAGAVGAVSGAVLVNKGDSEAEYIRANDEEAALAARQPAGQEPVAFDYPKFNAVGMGCVLEDRGVHFPIDAAQYGFDEALDQMKATIESIGPLYAAPTAHAECNGKLVAWWNGITPGFDGQGVPSIRWGADAENSGHDIPLYDGYNPIHYQRPAQAVDLRQFRDLIGFAALAAINLPETDPRRDFIRQANEFTKLIDGKAVRNG